MNCKLLRAATAACFFLANVPGSAQVQAEVPPVVPGARPATTELIKVHGADLVLRCIL